MKRIFIVWFALALAGRARVAAAALAAPQFLDKSYAFVPVRPLTDRERAADRFRSPLRGRVEFRDGILYRGGRPWFLVGSQVAGGQWNQKLMFLTRLMGDNYVTIAASPTRHFYSLAKNDRLALAWERVPFVKSMANEAARNRLLVYIDMGGGVARNMAGIVHRLQRHKLPGAQDWLDQCSEYYGHFYPIDVNSALGQQFYMNGFACYLRYFESADIPVVGVELRNELGVFAFTPQALAGFREFLRKKYGDLDTLNRVCRTRFTSFDEVLPPFLLDKKAAARVRREPFKLAWSFWVRTLADARKRYPEMFDDWVEFLRGQFAAGFEWLVRRVRERYGDRFPITLQTREERVPTEGYQAVDIERIAPHLDFWGQQISNVLFFHYDGEPAAPETVKEAMNRLTFYPDFGRGVCKKPILNTECIVEGSFPARRSLRRLAARSIARLEARWKYHTDAANAGRKQGWFRSDFDDSAWPEVAMPNLRTPNQPKRFRGRVWYRRVFPVDAKYQRLRDLDFKRFVLYIAAIVPRGRVYFNGRLVFAGGGAKREILIDVSDRLNYGGRNTLTVMIDNPRGWGGVDGPIALVDADDLRVKRSIDAGQTAALFWQHALHGHSGVNFWRVKQPIVNPEVVRARLAIESVADVLLPRPRIRGQVAVLYPFESFRGIVRRLADAPGFSEFMNVYAGLLFHHAPVDVLSCRGVLEGRSGRYRLLVVPMARLVRKGVFERVEEFVKQGGALLLTRDSLLRDDARYAPLPLERLIGEPAARASREGKATPAWLSRRVGRGTVFYLGDAPDFYKTFVALEKVLKATGVTPDADAAFEKSGEFPFVEIQVIRRPPRFLVYLMNWGGLEHRGALRLRREFLGAGARRYVVRDVRNAKPFGPGRYTADRLAAGVPIAVPPQNPLVLLFEAEGTKPLTLRRPAAGRLAVIRRLETMTKRKKLDPRKPSVLFLDVRTESHIERGRVGCPALVDLLEQGGCGVYERFATELSSEDLRRFSMVFIHEDYQGMWKQIEQTRPEFWGMLREYLEAGGSLFLAGTMHAGWNAGSFALNGILKPYRVSIPKRYPRNRPVWFEDPKHAADRDALDIVFRDIRPHPVTRGVRAVRLHCAAPVVDRGGRLTPLVLGAASDAHFPGQAAVCAGEIGRGRLVVSGEPYFMQPFRIEYEDNIKFVWNAMRWLLRNRIPDLSADRLRRRLMFREQDVEAWEAQEAAGQGAP